ncbi:MAG: carboxypeptidase regulatory-like domain-containing protein [Verrucomicrobiales bacterium]
MPQPSASRAAELHGQVIDATSKLPVEGATITVGEDGDNQIDTESGAFGFYELADVPPGPQVVKIDHRAYQSVEESVNFVGDAVSTRTDELVRTVADSAGIDLYFQVSCVKSGVLLEGAPVAVLRYSGQNDADVNETYITQTDANGSVILRGLPVGWYEIRINQSTDAIGPHQLGEWNRFPAAGNTVRQRFASTQHITVNLLPNERKLYTRVLGFDPQLRLQNQPLPKFWVELTGLERVVDPSGIGPVTYQDVLPPRAAVSNDEGNVTFSKLPNIPYRVTAKRMGYEFYEEILDPADFGGMLPGSNDAQPHALDVTYTPAHLWVNSESPYTRPEVLTNLNFTLAGIPDTNTDGFVRNAPLSIVQQLPDDRAFLNILPGRYQLTVDGEPQRTNFSAPYLSVRGSAFVQVGPGHPNFNFYQPEDFSFEPEFRKAKIRLRVFKAEQDATPDGQVIPDSVTQQYLFAPAAGEIVEFFEDPNASWLKDEFKTKTFQLSENGEATVELLPSKWKYRFPDRPDLVGWDLRPLYDETLGDINNGLQNQSALPDTFLGNARSFDLVAGHEYVLDIQLAKPFHHVGGILSVSGGSPVPFELSRLQLNGDYVKARIEERDGKIEPKEVRIGDSQGNDGQFYFTNLPDGTYTISLINLPDHYDPVNPVEITYPNGSTRASFSLTAQQSQGRLQFNVQRWFGEPINGYRDGNVPGLRPFPTSTLADYAKDVVRIRSSRIPPVGGYTFWGQNSGVSPRYYIERTVTAEQNVEGGVAEFDIFIDGPQNNVVFEPPMTPVEVTFRSLVEGTDSVVVPGTSFTVGHVVDGVLQEMPINLGDTGAHLLNEWTGNRFATPGSISNANWQLNGTEEVLIDAVALKYEQRLYFRRATRIKGEVARDQFPSSIPNARIIIKDSTGGFVREERADESGEFVFGQTLQESEPFFIEVVAPGFQTWRKRFTGADAVVDPTNQAQGLLDVTVFMLPLPLPTISDSSLDRRGLFLPWVNQQGSEDDVFTADEALTMTWVAQAEGKSYEDMAQPFDGTTAPERLFEDPISEIWLVDPRQWQGIPVDANPEPIPNIDPLLDVNADPVVKLAFLRSLEEGMYPNASFWKIEEPEAAEDGGSSGGSAEVKLWELPEGEFRPIVVAISEGGAVGMMRHEWSNEAEVLEGADVPEWLSVVLDVMGIVAGVKKVNDRVGAAEKLGFDAKELFPDGRLVPTGDFSVLILNDNDFLYYNYVVDISANEGMNSSAEKLIGLGPGFLGLQLFAQAKAEIEGQDKAVKMSLSGTATSEKEFDLERYTPKALGALRRFGVSGPTIEPGATVSMTTAFTKFLRENARLQAELSHTVEGMIGLRMEADVTRIATKQPILLVINKALGKYAPKLTAGAFGRISLASTTSWRTEYPTSVIARDQVARRDAIIGEELHRDRPDQQSGGPATQFILGFNFGADLTIESTSPLHSLTATGTLELRGEEKTFPNGQSLHVATVELNTDADFPFLKRIQGTIGASVDVDVSFLIFDYQKSWDWDLASFEKDLNTEASISFTPVTVTLVKTTPDMLPEVNPTGTALQPFRDSGGTFAAASSSGTARGLTLFKDVDPATGAAVLRASIRNANGTFGVSNELHRSGNFFDVATAALGDGEYVAAWTAVAANQLSNPFAASEIYFSRSTDGGANWTEPQMIYPSAGTAGRLTFVHSDGALAGLVFAEQVGSPSSSLASILGMRWDGSSFAAAETIVERTGVRAMAASGGKASGTGFVSYLNDASEVWAKPWPGAGAAQRVASDAGSELAQAGGSGEVHLTWSNQAGEIYASTHGAGGTWSAPEMLGVDATVTNMQVIATPSGNGGSGAFQLAWIAGGGKRDVRMLTNDPANPVRQITRNDFGEYASLTLTLIDAQTLGITARYLDGAGGSELRSIVVSMPDGTLIENDRDGDGMPDDQELRIADADPSDGLVLIGDIAPGDDFDGDGVSNGEEAEAGSDPTNRLDTPGGTVIPGDLIITSFQRLPDGAMEVVVQSMPDGTYILEGSDDLETFTELSRTTATGDSTTLTDDPPPVGKRYYRVRKF